MEGEVPDRTHGGVHRPCCERDHIAVAASLRPFLEPAGVAVIGASARRGSIGGELFRNVIAAGFRGPAHPVNRSGEEVAGVPAVRSVREITDDIDLAVICLPAEGVLAAAEDARKGVRALCVISAGFAEVGAEGAARQDTLLALVRSHGGRLLGPNCLGVAAAGVAECHIRRERPAAGNRRLRLAERRPRPRRGGAGAGPRPGYRRSCRSGTRPTSRPTTCSNTGKTTPARTSSRSTSRASATPSFARIARRVARRKPVLALKGGVSAAGARAAASHTAALAGSDAAVDALFHQAGVQPMRTLSELLDAAALLSSQPPPVEGWLC